MDKNDIKLLCMTVILLVSATGITGMREQYRAGVMEIMQFNNGSYSTLEIIQKNFEQYTRAAKIAKSHNVDMMVYPEEGLFPNAVDNRQVIAEDIPNPVLEQDIPCDHPDKFQNSPIFRNLSCLAKDNNLYITAAVIDVKECVVKSSCNKYNIDYCRKHKNHCPEDNKFYFNTIVVLDRRGKLIARYYKRHLFFEPLISVPRDHGNVYFSTDFGASSPDVTQLSYPTWWYDQTPPIFFAAPIQQALSMTSKINVLAANVQYPALGSLGSGIYSATEGALVYTYNPDLRSKVLIANVPSSSTNIPEGFSADPKFYYLDDDKVTELHGEEPRQFKEECDFNVLGNATTLSDYRCTPLEVQQFTFVKLNETKANIDVCSNEFCCSLDYEANSMKETFYFGVSGNQINFHDIYLLGMQACFLARCEPVDGEPCRNFLLKSNTIFNTVEIKASFNTTYIYPYAIDSENRLTHKDEWDFDGNSTISYQSKKNRALQFFGLNGRLYGSDVKLHGATF